jgi:hypothetical protein
VCLDGAIPREKGIPMSTRHFPDHYERTRIEGKEHPADFVIDHLPVIVRFQSRLSRLSVNLRKSVQNRKPFIEYVDARGMYQSMRENLFYNAGFEHGLLAARQDNLVERMASDPVARRLLAEINQLTLTTELPRNRVVMLLLEAAWAMIYGIAIPGEPSTNGSLELAAIREVLWPGGDMEHTWTPETIDEVARIARPKKGGHHE